MSSSDRTPSFHSYSPTGMDGLNGVSKIEGGNQGNPPQKQYLYLQVTTAQGHPLPPNSIY